MSNGKVSQGSGVCERLDRIAEMLEKLFILQRGHAKDCEYINDRYASRPCTCDYQKMGGK
jgi:hypothetical protein